MIASAVIPQYGCAEGLKLLRKNREETTHKEMKNILLDRNYV